MKIKNFSAIIIFCRLMAMVLSRNCLPLTDSPCVCNYKTIRCEGNQSFDLKSVFQNISKTLSENDKNFDFFVLNNSGIQRLENNTFGEITFRFLSIIDAQSLETIESYAFNGTGKRIEVFEMIGQTGLKNMNELFSSIGLLENVFTITLNLFGLKSLPSFAFDSLKQLQELTIINGQLNHIANNSFDVKNVSDQSLIIDLSTNNLTEFSFDINSLVGIKRPLELDLRDNRITILEKNIFKPFLMNNIRNSLNLSANPLNCSDCRNQWLVEDKHIFESNVLEARCAHFVSIFELQTNHFRNCLN